MKHITAILVVVVYLFAGAKAFGLTQQERVIVEQMQDRISALRVDADAREKVITGLTDTLILQSNESAALTVDLRKKDSEVKALISERDGLKVELVSKTDELEKAKDHIADLGKKVEAAKLEAHKNAKERDVVIWAFAIVVTGMSITLLRPILASVPPPYGLVAWPAAVIAVFFLCYAFGRILLSQVAAALPL